MPFCLCCEILSSTNLDKSKSYKYKTIENCNFTWIFLIQLQPFPSFNNRLEVNAHHVFSVTGSKVRWFSYTGLLIGPYSYYIINIWWWKYCDIFVCLTRVINRFMFAARWPSSPDLPSAQKLIYVVFSKAPCSSFYLQCLRFTLTDLQRCLLFSGYPWRLLECQCPGTTTLLPTILWRHPSTNGQFSLGTQHGSLIAPLLVLAINICNTWRREQNQRSVCYFL